MRAIAVVLALGMSVAATLCARADTVIAVAHVENTPGELALWDKIGHDFSAAHPGVTVRFRYIENEAFKAKLTTMLQSDDPPGIIYSWGGGVMRAQVEAGYLRAVGNTVRPATAGFVPAAAHAFDVDGKTYGIPTILSEVAFFYNKALFAKAGVDASGIHTWDDFLAAVKKLKAAGITPIIVGAGEKWPMHFYWSYLALRAGGIDIVERAREGKDGGFSNPAFVEAGQRLRELAQLDPFQPGYVGTMHMQAEGLFGDGRGAMELMGNWLVNMQKDNAANGKGVPLDQIGVLAFPVLPGGKGKASDALGGINGFLVTKNAPKEAEDFLAFFAQPKYQQELARVGYYIPPIRDASALIGNPVTKQIADSLDHASGLQIFFDQDLGPSVGRTVNDVSVAVAAGQMTPADAARAVQRAWDEQ